MSGPRPWMGDPEAPTTLTQARARIPRGQAPFSICTCWIDSCGPAACATSGSAAAIAAHHAFGCLVTMFLLLPLLAERATLELELDVPQLDDVVVDQIVLLDLLVVNEAAVRAVQVGDLELAALVADGGVLARDLLVGEDDVAVGGGADDVLAHPQAEVLALVLAVERHQPAAHFPALVGGAAALVAAAHVAQVHHGGAAARGRHHHAAASAAHHRLLHLQAVGAG